MFQTRPWNKYEVALLLEAYILISVEHHNISETLSQLSENLRSMEVYVSGHVDDKFRNLNGMHWQYGIIKSAFEDRHYESHNPPKLFLEMIKLYRENKQQFDTILEEAHALIKKSLGCETNNMKSLKDAFIEFYNNLVYKKVNASKFVNCFDQVSEYAQKHGISKRNFWEIDNVREFNAIRTKLSSNRVFKFTYPTDFRLFEHIGKYYSEFLKQLPVESTSPSLITHKERSDFQSKNKLIADQCCANNSSIQSSMTQQKSVDAAPIVRIDEDKPSTSNLCDCIITLNDTTNLSYTKPVFFSISSNANVYVSSWTDLYVKLIQVFFADNAKCFTLNESFGNGTRADIGSKENMIAPKWVCEDVYLETNVSATGIIGKLRYACMLCHTDCDSIKIGYNKKRTSLTARPGAVRYIHLMPNEEKALREVFEKNFKFGYRIDSIIDHNKLERFVSESGIKLPDDFVLKKWIIQESVEHSGKYYFISQLLSMSLCQLFDEAFSTGAQLVYYESLYDANYELLDSNGVTSVELLKNIFEKFNTKYIAYRNYATLINDVNGELRFVEKELLRVWGDDVVRCYTSLYDLLPYIPQEKIRSYLSKSKSFVWNAQEEFANIHNIAISSQDKDSILLFVKQQCSSHGFVTLNDLPISQLLDEYCNVSVFAMQQAVYELLLKEEYELNGKLLSFENNKADLETMIRNYCLSKEEYSFDEINDYASSISGEINRQISFKVAYENLVRIDKEHFISDKLITFDVVEIDKSLSKLFTRDYLPLQDVISFIMFPYCGYAWNRYLLESYCLRFSKEYALLIKSFNNKNVGVIIPKDSDLSYNDVLVDAIVHSNAKYDVDNMENYLYNNGYIAKRTLGNLEELIAQAKKIKEDK